jgi:hypothetical protein
MAGSEDGSGLREPRPNRLVEALSCASIEDSGSGRGLPRNLGTTGELSELDTAFTIGVDLTGIRTLRSLRDATRVHRCETEQLVHPGSRRSEALDNG